MNDHTLKVLEYRETLSQLAAYAQSDPGRALAMALFPRSRKSDVLHECSTTEQALYLLENNPPDLGSVTDTSAILARLAVRGSVLEPMELYSLLRNQVAVRHARAALRDRESELPELNSLVKGMANFPEWENWIERSVSPKGEVLDTASHELARVRKELLSCRNTAVGKLETFIRSKSVAKVIQEQYVTIRNGRFVVPAKQEYHRAFEGVVQDTSQSGQTIFVEPLFAVPLNNQHTVELAREESEVKRILARMSDEAAVSRDEMASNLGMLANLDLVLAKARLGVKLNGIIPGLSDDQTVLTDARHPHLVLEPGIKCVPIDMRIGGPSPTLVITGPNTGGKTVALKTLGLLTMMVQSGIPVPVSQESHFRIFGKIFADIGDEQSLSQNLSTFSGHMNIIAGLLADADAKTLVLLDELGAGTDPQEGSALGIALLEFLYKRESCVAVTTHHNLLKEFAYRAPYASNASTVFDPETLEPTFRLRMGAPGRSHALEVARSLGLQDEIIDRAREVMGSGAVQVDELLGRLTKEVDKESLARERAEEVMKRLEDEHEELASRRTELDQKAQDQQKSMRLEAKALLRDIERRGRVLLKKIQEEGGRKDKKPLFTENLREMKEEILEKFPPPPPRKGHGPISLGDEVEVLSLGVQGTVSEIFAGGREAEVLSGGIRMKVPAGDLTPMDHPGAKTDGDTKKGNVSYSGSHDAPAEINLIGTKVEDALKALDKALDRSMFGTGRTLRIVHGKGTGTLKKAVGEALKKDPRVSAFGPAPLNEGGAGVTLVELKE